MKGDWLPLLQVDPFVSQLTREERYELFLTLETKTDVLLETEMISQEMAWDMYFGLLHECDDSRFLADRPRILAKIDTNRYNPFLSTNPEIVMLARIRAAGLGLTNDQN